jgi:hypothetical protein
MFVAAASRTSAAATSSLPVCMMEMLAALLATPARATVSSVLPPPWASTYCTSAALSAGSPTTFAQPTFGVVYSIHASPLLAVLVVSSIYSFPEPLQYVYPSRSKNRV